MNMFKPVGAKSDDEYIAMLEPGRKAQIEKLDELIRTTVPNLKRYFAYNMLGYGTFTYRNYKKEEVNWPVVALASQKNYISLYVCCVVDGGYLAESYKDRLGKVSVGKSCIRFKKVEDINLDVVREVLMKAENNPGLTVE